MANRRYAARVFPKLPKQGELPAFTCIVEAEGYGEAMDKIDQLARDRGLEKPYIAMQGGEQA